MQTLIKLYTGEDAIWIHYDSEREPQVDDSYLSKIKRLWKAWRER